MTITTPHRAAIKLFFVLAAALAIEAVALPASATISGSTGFFICNAAGLCWTRSGDATGDLVAAVPYQGLETQRWIQVNNCTGQFCFPVQYESPTKTSARVGITTTGQFQMTTDSTNWLSFRPMLDYIYDANAELSVVTSNGASEPLIWGSANGQTVNNIWQFWDAPLLLIGEIGSTPTGTTLYSEYQSNGAAGTVAHFVNGTDNCIYTPQSSPCTWSGNAISGWQGEWALVPFVFENAQTALLGADVGGNVSTYWNAVSVTFMTEPEGAETFGEGLYPGTTHSALFLEFSPFGGTYHLSESTGSTAMTVTSGDPGGFGGNHVFAVPGSGN